MIILTLEQILELHALVIETTGGSAGLRDLGRIEAAVATQTQAVFGEELYPGVLNKAAALMRGIIQDHAFIDGNKRTGMLVGLTFLRVNGLILGAEKGEIENFAVKAATHKLSVTDIADWLRVHTEPKNA